MAGWFWKFKFFQLYFLYAMVFDHGKSNPGIFQVELNFAQLSAWPDHEILVMTAFS